MSSPKIKPRAAEARVGATTADDFLGGCLTIVQPRNGHRAGGDAVFLAAAVPERSISVLDVGAGVGVAGLCLLARVPEVEVTAVETDGRLCALAEKNAAGNGFAGRFKTINADITAKARDLHTAGLIPESYDHVIANPPFHAEGAVRSAPDRARALAHVMGRGQLGAWVRFLCRMTSPKGQMTLIHRPECLGELLALLEGRFGNVAIFPLFPKAGEPATRVILQGRKGSRASPRLLEGLVLHESDGRYTARAEEILRGGQGLDLGHPRRGERQT